MNAESLIRNITPSCKDEWKPLLHYHAKLHVNSTHKTNGTLPYDWEDIGVGYCYGPAFGHWDIIHQILDSMKSQPDHVCMQLANDMYHQQPDGLIPGSLWMRSGNPEFAKDHGHPPFWIIAVDDYARIHDSKEMQLMFLPNLLKQIKWFENNRKADQEGFYYLDILTNQWESGIDESVRFDNIQTGALACIDASSHVYWMYNYAANWLEIAGQETAAEYKTKADKLRKFITTSLYSTDKDFFYDIWSVNTPEKRVTTFDGFWPLACGVATEEQANKLIDLHLLNEKEFLTEHPVPTIAANEPLFEQRMWRGPAWNSMTYWLARGCLDYNRPDAAKILLEKSLDATAEQFSRTNSVWEFYHSRLGAQEEVARKPHTDQNTPCRDYLGHNPLFAMEQLYHQAISTM